jgi:hypothetical protein
VSHHLVGVVGNLLDSVPETEIGIGFVIRVKGGIEYYSLPNLGVEVEGVGMVGLG